MHTNISRFTINVIVLVAFLLFYSCSFSGKYKYKGEGVFEDKGYGASVRYFLDLGPIKDLQEYPDSFNLEKLPRTRFHAGLLIPYDVRYENDIMVELQITDNITKELVVNATGEISNPMWQWGNFSKDGIYFVSKP